MTFVAIMTFSALVAIAALHAAWGFGSRFPAQSKRSLVALVIGESGREEMPSAVQCLAAAAAIFVASLVALMLAGLISPPVPAGLVAGAGALIALIFAARGIAGYLPAWRRRFSQEPFAALDQRLYSPLCFVLAAAFAALFFYRTAMLA